MARKEKCFYLNVRTITTEDQYYNNIILASIGANNVVFAKKNAAFQISYRRNEILSLAECTGTLF